MKAISSIFLILFFSQIVSAQKIDSAVFETISNQLIDDRIEDYTKDIDIERREECVYGKKEGFTLSCIRTYYNLNWVTDFDGDGNNDIVIQVTDEGLGGGGNAFGFDFVVITLNKNKTIKNQYSLFGGGKMSYALLEIDTVTNGHIYATYEQNPYGYGFEKVTFDHKENLSLDFYLKDDKLVEKSYKKCPIADMNKAIFKDNTSFNIKRNLSLDDGYNDEQTEYLYLKDSTYFYSSLSGCQNINIIFTHTIPYQASLENNKNSIKKVWAEHLLFLKENTRYTSVLNELYLQLNALKTDKMKMSKYGGSQHEFVLKYGWIGTLFLSGNKEQGSFITIRIDKVASKNKLDFWESLKAKQQLK